MNREQHEKHLYNQFDHYGKYVQSNLLITKLWNLVVRTVELAHNKTKKLVKLHNNLH